MQAITFQELKEMTSEQHAKLVSICCKYDWDINKPRSKVIGIQNVSVKYSKNIPGMEWQIKWSDEDGDTVIYTSDLNQKIDAFCDDGGRWLYGLYKE